ncbi:MAG: hypothetical protein WKF78_05440 [Candidatus Limnocylindrales bacterium]
MSRYYRVHHFEIIAAACSTRRAAGTTCSPRAPTLLRLSSDPDYLATMQPHRPAVVHPWYRTLAELR